MQFCVHSGFNPQHRWTRDVGEVEPIDLTLLPLYTPETSLWATLTSNHLQHLTQWRLEQRVLVRTGIFSDRFTEVFRPDGSCKIGCSQNVKCLFLQLCFCFVQFIKLCVYFLSRIYPRSLLCAKIEGCIQILRQTPANSSRFASQHLRWSELRLRAFIPDDCEQCQNWSALQWVMMS